MSATVDTPRPPVAGAARIRLDRARAAADTAATTRVWRVGLAALLALTTGLYLWDLGASGWANSYYAAAAQAGGESWKAWLFGALDPGAWITVDKPPASLWAMGLSVRLFGLSSWSILVPQALMGVAAVGLLAATVRRVAGPAAGLAAGLLCALTPVAALMFRFDNPDALLTLLLVVAAWGLTRALEGGRYRWLVVAGAAVGLAFLAKMLQAFLVLPAFALVWAVAAPVGIARRLVGLVVAAASVVASAGWYIVLVEWWPFGSRPYIGGSGSDSILALTLGYNGLDRISGGSGPGGGGPGGSGNVGFGGAAGLWRLFGESMGTQIGWLLPAALAALAAGLVLTWRRPRTDATRAALLLWGGWLVVSGLVLSFMSGIVHPYYTVALAPAVAALVAIGGTLLLQRRDTVLARIVLAGIVLGSALWARELLGRTPDWHPWLATAVVVAGAVAAILALLPPSLPRARVRGAALGIAAAVALLAAPAACTLATVTTPHSGSIPMAGPTASAMGGPGAAGMGAAGLPQGMGPGGAPPQGATGARTQGLTGTPPQGMTGDGADGASAQSDLVALLAADDSGATWAAAAVGSQTAGTLQLESGKAVLTIGGFNGGDASPTLEQFQQLAAAGEIRYLVAGGQGGMGGGPGGGSGTASAIQEWAAATYTATTVGGQTVYDLTAPLA